MRAPAALLCLVACSSDHDAAPTSVVRDPFIAFASDFEPYMTWESLYIPGAELDDPIHGGNRTIYVNHRPPKGSKQFPVGTIIVKQMAFPDGQTFAMVKRGGGYNPQGAVNWEWFRIDVSKGTVTIAWRGVGPPAGEMYGGDAGGVCNGCHFAGKDNDWVQYPGLKL